MIRNIKLGRMVTYTGPALELGLGQSLTPGETVMINANEAFEHYGTQQVWVCNMNMPLMGNFSSHVDRRHLSPIRKEARG